MDTLEDIPTSTLARELARRRRTEKTCAREVCGQAFSGYPTQKWCSRRCADAAYYQEHREERDAARAKYARKSRSKSAPTTVL